MRQCDLARRAQNSGRMHARDQVLDERATHSWIRQTMTEEDVFQGKPTMAFLSKCSPSSHHVYHPTSDTRELTVAIYNPLNRLNTLCNACIETRQGLRLR